MGTTSNTVAAWGCQAMGLASGWKFVVDGGSFVCKPTKTQPDHPGAGDTYSDYILKEVKAKILK
ncbi:MAG: hypothetical protein IPH28_00250 [Cytophagaceae bacterium]|nr:hypothetical protein [Cytophagaceae bacterium]